MVSRRMVLAFALVCMAGSRARAAGSEDDDDDGEPRYMLAAFDAKGRDLNHYAIDNVKRMVFITDQTTRKQLWRRRVGLSRNYECLFRLYLAPDRRHAVLSCDGNPHAGASFDWISIPEGRAAATCVDIPLENRFRAMVAESCGMPESRVSFLYATFLGWTTNETCRLKWECKVYDDADEDRYNVGIVEFTLGEKSEQRLQITSVLKGLTLAQMVDAKYGAKVTLRPGGGGEN